MSYAAIIQIDPSGFTSDDVDTWKEAQNRLSKDHSLRFVLLDSDGNSTGITLSWVRPDRGQRVLSRYDLLDVVFSGWAVVRYADRRRFRLRSPDGLRNSPATRLPPKRDITPEWATAYFVKNNLHTFGD